MFNAFNATPRARRARRDPRPDPYHGPGQAHGLCFSVRRGVPPPPSLKNIYKELATDLPGFVKPDHGNRELGGAGRLPPQRVARARGEANSHAKLGWQAFADEVIKVLNRQPQKRVFILWGGFAQKKACASQREQALRPQGGAPVAALGGQVPRLRLLARATPLAKEGEGEVDGRVRARRRGGCAADLISRRDFRPMVAAAASRCRVVPPPRESSPRADRRSRVGSPLWAPPWW